MHASVALTEAAHAAANVLKLLYAAAPNGHC